MLRLVWTRPGRKDTWITTVSGRKIAPFDPKPEQFEISDLAHSLSRQCRFGGHIEPFYSVAQHSVYVMRATKLSMAKYWGLMHDASEAVITDLPTPIKRYIPDYEAAEDKIQRVISRRFHIPRGPTVDAAVKEADTLLLCWEAYTLHPDPMSMNFLKRLAGRVPKGTLRDLDPQFRCWSPDEAKARFLAEFAEISPFVTAEAA